MYVPEYGVGLGREEEGLIRISALGRACIVLHYTEREREKEEEGSRDRLQPRSSWSKSLLHSVFVVFVSFSALYVH